MPTPLDALRAALDRAVADGAPLAPAFQHAGDHVIETVDDAHTLAAIAARFPAPANPANADWCVALRGLVGLFQAVDAIEPFDVLREEGLPHLLALADARLAQLDVGDAAGGEELLFLLKVAAMYRVEEAVERTIAAARRPVAPGSYLWSVLFEVHDADHPYRARLFQALRDPLPPGFLGVAYLDFANVVVAESHASSHPFDTPEGRDRLRSFLTESPPTSHARSAAGALAYVARPGRDELLALAMDHPSVDVQMEAARGAASLGSEAAITFLVRACDDPRTLKAAYASLIELGHGGRIPRAALDPNVQALAEMAEWLSHPSEFGRPPDRLDLLDTRTLAWPPTRDARRLWLVRYGYDDDAGSDAMPQEGVGLVGSITFALFGEATADVPPDDLYALYCAWELMARGDPRAPGERTADAGRAILARAAIEGPGFG